MGKFTIVEEAPSTSGQNSVAEATSTNGKESAASTQDSLDDAFTIKTTQARRRGSKRTPVTPVVQAVANAPANYHVWSQLLIGSANTVVVTWLGAECSMEKREADMLEPPIARILERLTPEQSAKVSVFIDPMVMLIALGMWGNRIIRIQRAKKDTISSSEFQRANGFSEAPPPEEAPQYADPPDLRQKVAVNPNGIPVAITNQMGEV